MQFRAMLDHVIEKWLNCISIIILVSTTLAKKKHIFVNAKSKERETV